MSVILCTAGYDHTIRFWEALSGICSRTIQHPESQVNRLCITPDKRYLAAAGRHNVKLYDIKSTNPNPVMVFEGHSNNITGVAFHCEGKWMVTSSEDCTVKVWDTRSGSLQRNYLHGSAVNDVVIHPNQGELISADRAGNVRVWDLGENRCTHQLIPEEDVSVASVSVSSDGALLAAGNNKGNIYIWRIEQEENFTSLRPVTRFQAHKDHYITRVLISPDVKHLATCSADHTVKIWSMDPDLPDPWKDEEREDEAKRAAAAANGAGDVSPGAKVNGTLPYRAARSNTADSNSSPSRRQTNGSSTALVTPNGANNNMNSASSIKPHITPSPPLPTPHRTTRPPGEIPYSTRSGFLPLTSTLSNHQRWVWDCAFSADSAYLVTVCSDHYARLWELNSNTVIRQYNGHHRGAVCVALNDYSEPR